MFSFSHPVLILAMSVSGGEAVKMDVLLTFLRFIALLFVFVQIIGTTTCKGTLTVCVYEKTKPFGMYVLDW